MQNACAVPTEAQRRYLDALTRAERVMLEKIVAACKEAEETASTAFVASKIAGTPPPPEYFVASAHQKLYCILCHADPDTFAGGDAKIAEFIIRNSQNIARRYWSADAG